MKLFVHLFASLTTILVRQSLAQDITNATCSANEQCVGLTGDCCPTPTTPLGGGGIDLFCCDTTDGSCATNPRCVLENLTGECCPTTDNVFLDCCERDFAKCSAHPKCAHLANDCCPTPVGQFLDCCQDDPSLDNITFPENDALAACSANSACGGLDGNCCPTNDGVYLYCCGQPPRTSGYQVVQTLVSPSINESLSPLFYLVSSSPYQVTATGVDDRAPVVYYNRNSSETFDLVYYRDSFDNAIPDASEFVQGKKKFYIDLWTDAPPCTQVWLQLDNLPSATPENFPTGRHSRYITLTTKEQQWERLEFDWLDLLDLTVPNDAINAVALFFNPGNNETYQYYFDFLDITEEGCTEGNCEIPSVKNCSAYFGGEEEADVEGDTTSEPTDSPTSTPTHSPTSAPSGSPTSAPSNGPSASPSNNPTSSPTNGPTNTPTFSPTFAPTLAPSAGPSTSPTTVPTAVPSESPTAVPTTVAPTGALTESPTTATPTTSPTSSPTLSPTTSPSASPSSTPTVEPSTGPTARPSEGPSTPPTFKPTTSPTFQPTSSPTFQPTSSPTSSPTSTPTNGPTDIPTESLPLLRDAPACADGIDNDGDGHRDCTDPDCCLTIQCWGRMRRSLSLATFQLQAASSQQETPNDTPSPEPEAASSAKMYRTKIMSLLGLLVLSWLWNV